MAQDDWIWQGWGTSLCWFANAIGSRPDDVNIACDQLFGRNGLWFNIVRYNIGGSDPRRAGEFRTGGAVPCVSGPDGAVDLERDASQIAFLRAAVATGNVDQVHAFCNSPPWFWTESGSSKGATRPLRDNLKSEHVDAFVDFVGRVVKALEEKEGIECTTTTFFNEPFSPTWVEPSSRQEGCFVSPIVANRLVKAGLSHDALGDRLSAHDENSVWDALLRYGLTPRKERKRLRQVALHTYALRNFSDSWWAKAVSPLQDNALIRWCFRKWTDAEKVERIVSEYGQGADDLSFARHVLRDLRTLRPVAWAYWQAIEDVDSSWGLLRMSLEGSVASSSPVRNVKYDIMRLFTHHIRPGMKVFVPKGRHGLCIAAADDSGINVVRCGKKGAKDIRFDGFHPVQRDAVEVQTDQEQLTAVRYEAID